MKKALVVGIGNEDRGDDAAGVELLTRVVARPHLELLDAGTVPESYIGRMTGAGAQTILLVDAVDFGGRPGEVVLFDRLNAPADICSTHRAPLGLLMDFLRSECDAEVVLLGIQPKDTRLGAPMSLEVRNTVHVLAVLMNENIMGAIETLRQPNAAA